MQFQTDLVPATLIRRYKRFLSDVRLEDGREVTAHCPNPGAMTGLADPGTRIWLEPNDDPKKKLKYGWRLSELKDGGFACIDTGIANKVVGEALRAGLIAPLADYKKVQSEVAYGTGSRVDFFLSEGPAADAFVEVKSVTLMREPGLAEFPDSVTKRGAKHLGELEKTVENGQRAVMIYLVQRTDCDRTSVAQDIDPAYATATASATAAGVEFLSLSVEMNETGVTYLGVLK